MSFPGFTRKNVYDSETLMQMETYDGYGLVRIQRINGQDYLLHMVGKVQPKGVKKWFVVPMTKQTYAKIKRLGRRTFFKWAMHHDLMRIMTFYDDPYSLTLRKPKPADKDLISPVNDKIDMWDEWEHKRIYCYPYMKNQQRQGELMNDELPTYEQLQHQQIMNIYMYFNQPLFYYAIIKRQGYLFIWNDVNDFWLIKIADSELAMSKTMTWHDLFNYFVKNNRVNRLRIKKTKDSGSYSCQPFDPKVDELPLSTKPDEIIDLTKSCYS